MAYEAVGSVTADTEDRLHQVSTFGVSGLLFYLARLSQDLNDRDDWM